MTGTDVAPSRLERAKQKIRDLIALRAGGRVGARRLRRQRASRDAADRRPDRAAAVPRGARPRHHARAPAAAPRRRWRWPRASSPTRTPPARSSSSPTASTPATSPPSPRAAAPAPRWSSPPTAAAPRSPTGRAAPTSRRSRPRSTTATSAPSSARSPRASPAPRRPRAGCRTTAGCSRCPPASSSSSGSAAAPRCAGARCSSASRSSRRTAPRARRPRRLVLDPRPAGPAASTTAHDYAEAAEAFADPEWRAAALFRAGKYTEAADTPRADPDLDGAVQPRHGAGARPRLPGRRGRLRGGAGARPGQRGRRHNLDVTQAHHRLPDRDARRTRTRRQGTEPPDDTVDDLTGDQGRRVRIDAASQLSEDAADEWMRAGRDEARRLPQVPLRHRGTAGRADDPRTSTSAFCARPGPRRRRHAGARAGAGQPQVSVTLDPEGPVTVGTPVRSP